MPCVFTLLLCVDSFFSHKLCCQCFVRPKILIFSIHFFFHFISHAFALRDLCGVCVCVCSYIPTYKCANFPTFVLCLFAGWMVGWSVGLVRRVSTWNSILLTFSRALSCSSLQCFLVLAIIVGWLVSFSFARCWTYANNFFFVAIKVASVGCCFAFSWQDEEKHVVRSLFTRNLVNGLDKSIPCRNLNTIVYMYVCMYVWRCIGISDINCICCWAEEVIRKFCFFFFGCNRNLFWKLHQTIGLFYFRSKLIWSFLVLTI